MKKISRRDRAGNEARYCLCYMSVGCCPGEGEERGRETCHLTFPIHLFHKSSCSNRRRKNPKRQTKHHLLLLLPLLLNQFTVSNTEERLPWRISLMTGCPPSSRDPRRLSLPCNFQDWSVLAVSGTLEPLIMNSPNSEKPLIMNLFLTYS